MLRIRKELTSPGNPAVKAFARLVRSRRRREEDRLAPAFSHRLLRECLLRPGLVQEAFVTERALAEHGLDDALASASEQQELGVSLCSEKVMEKLGSEDGTAFLARLLPPSSHLSPEVAPPVIPSPVRRLLVLDAVRDPGNVGTLIRTAHVLGWSAVFLLGSCVDAFSSKVMSV